MIRSLKMSVSLAGRELNFRDKETEKNGLEAFPKA